MAKKCSDRLLLATQDVQYLDGVLGSWKPKHKAAVRVLDLETVFERVRTTVDYAFKVDNECHLEALDKGIVDGLEKEWHPLFRKLLSQAREALSVIERKAKKLGAGQYRGAVITDAALEVVLGRVDHGLTALKEWDAWTPPKTKPATRPSSKS